MFKLTTRGLLAHKIRFALTTFAVVLGVAFVVGSFVISDGLRSTFDEIVEGINADVDAEVRGAAAFDGGDQAADLPIDESIADDLATLAEVDEAIPVLTVFSIVPIRDDGEPIETAGAPLISTNFDTSSASDTNLVDGENPSTGRFITDVDTAEAEDLVVGNDYDVVTSSGRERFELAGTFRFGDDNVLAGARLFVFDLEDLQRISGFEGQVQEIQLTAAAGVSPEELVAAVSAVLPASAEVVTGETATQEDQDDFAQIIDIFGNVLLGFAAVALFVAAYLINNTFNIVLGQRVRELALLRAIGASARQVRTSVIGESLLVGVVASVVGLAVGYLLAIALRGLFNAFGFGLPALRLGLNPRTVVLAFVIGVGITMLASIAPSRRASRVPPVAAMQDGYRFGSGEDARRTVIGLVTLGVGVVSMAVAILVDFSSAIPTLLYLSLGALGVFVGVTMLSPLFSSPVATALGAPLRHVPWLGMAGQLAQENSARNNQRTAATAGALMIGLALVGTTAVAGESLKASFTESLSNSTQADYLIQGNFGTSFGSGLAEQLRVAEEFDQVSAFRVGRIQVNGDGKDAFGADLAELDGLVDLDIQTGDLAGAGPGSILIHIDSADDNDLVVGDTVTVAYVNGETEDLELAAIYADVSVISTNWIIDLDSYTSARFGTEDDVFVAASLAEGVSLEESEPIVERLQDEFPQVTIENQTEFIESSEEQLDSFLAIVNGMLAFAVLIALLGIANTLALSVFERTREIGLLRAVGMSRRQTRSMIRWEAAIVAIFGALLGVVLGVLFGFAVVTILPDSIISQFAVPVGTLVIYVVVAGLAGLVAAWLPARRAGRLNVLDAIQHQ